MIDKNNERIQVLLTKKEVKKLQDMAAEDGRSTSNLAAMLIRKGLKSKK